MKLKNLTHDTGHYLTRHQYGDVPASFLFVEAVAKTGILGKAGSARLNQILQATVGKLQNFMTPGASSDLESILGFTAPKGGGLAKVKEMATKAGQLQTSIFEDQNWWQEMFTAFDVIDPAVQQQIIQKTQQSAGLAPTLPGQKPQKTPRPQQPQQAPQQPQQAPQQPQQAPQQSVLAAEIAKNTAAREASAGRISAIQQQMDALQAQQAARRAQRAAGKQPPTSEAVWNYVALQLLNEADVKSNLKFVASNLMRRLGYASTTPFQEVNWLKKFVGNFNKPVEEGFQDFFRNLRTTIANPDHLAQNVHNGALKSFNERAAKLAIGHLSDYATTEFNQKLGLIGLTVKDAVEAVAEYKKLAQEFQQMPDKRNASAEFRARCAAVGQKLSLIHNTFASNTTP